MRLTKNISKHAIHIHDDVAAFSVKDELHHYADIEAFYYSENVLFTNAVYMGKCNSVSIRLKGEARERTYKCNRNDKNDHLTLKELANSIGEYRRPQIIEIYQKQQQYSFRLFKKNYTLLTVAHDGIVFHEQKIDRIHVVQGRGGIELVAANKTFFLPTNTLSDATTFLELAARHVLIHDKQYSFGHNHLLRVYCAIVVVFGVNGWLDSIGYAVGMQVSIIEVLSVMSKIMLSVHMLTAPLYLIVAKVNARNIAKDR